MAQIYDLVVVGAGINGSALARLAAFNGIKTLLIDKADIASETSSNSSKLIHGGLRYLEGFHLGLVWEALHERERLLKQAPHLVTSHQIYLPITEQSRHGSIATRLALTLYDLMAGRLGRGHQKIHQLTGHSDLKHLRSHTASAHKNAVYSYPDCMVDDARLTLELALDAQTLGAQLSTYTEFLGVEESRDKETRNLLEVSLCNKSNETDYEVYTKKLAFCLGPWNDIWTRREFSQTNPALSRSQGIHLFYEDLPLQGAFLLPVPKSTRFFFVLPYQGGHLVGTTETSLAETDPGPFVPTDSEIAEMEKCFAYYFPDLVRPYTCVTVGVRPLARTSKAHLSQASRSPAFHKLHDQVYAGVGGKYTTHAPFAQTLLQKLYGKEKSLKPVYNRLLPGSFTKGAECVDEQLKLWGFGNADLRKLWLTRYGQRALEVGEFVLNVPGGKELLSSKVHLLKGEVLFSIRHELARCAQDFFRRRTSLFFTKEGGLDLFHEVSEIFAQNLPENKNLEKLFSYTDYLHRHRHSCL